MRHALAVAAFLVVSAGVALGADSEQARDHYLKGTRAFELGLYDEAIAEYVAAYKIKDDPALLFNLGQAHRLANHPAEALHFYKTYLSKMPEATNRAEVEAKMAEMSRLLERPKPPAREPPPEAAPVTPAASAPSREARPTSVAAKATPVVPPATVPVATMQTEPTEASNPGQGLRLAGMASAAGGLALVGTGIVFGVLARRASDDLTQLDQNRGVFDPSKESAGQRDQILAGVFLGVGAAAIATGAVLYVLGARNGDETAHAVLISPSVAAHAAGASMRLVF
jgi:tetratricopeptide (TPR) repeat protein